MPTTSLNHLARTPHFKTHQQFHYNNKKGVVGIKRSSSLRSVLKTSKSEDLSHSFEQFNTHKHESDNENRQRKDSEPRNDHDDVGTPRKTSFKLPEKRLTRRHSVMSRSTSKDTFDLHPKSTSETHKERSSTGDIDEKASTSRLSVDSQENLQSRRATLVDAQANRKSSFTSSQSPNRMSFMNVTKRVTNLLRFRNAAQPRKPSIAEEQVISPTEIVEDLPKTPRFSSFMSAEAQYAMMKGYEDIVADKLSSTYPEYNGMLKRNKTPHHSIAIKEITGIERSRCKRKGFTHTADKGGNGPNGGNDNVFTHEQTTEDCNPKSDSATNVNGSTGERAVSTSSDSQNHIVDSPTPTTAPVRRNSEKTQSWESSSSTIASPTPKEVTLTPLQNLRRLSLSFPANATKNSDDDVMGKPSPDRGKDTTAIRYSGQSTSPPASPSRLNRERRIVMSYRLERAMDMLDTMKSKYEHTLSPRIKEDSRRQTKPVVDFNRWTDQWATEFQTNSVK